MDWTDAILHSRPPARLQGLESLLPAGGGGGAGAGLRRVSSSAARGRDENASPERRSPFLLARAAAGSSPALADEAPPPRKALSEGSGMQGSQVLLSPMAPTDGSGATYQAPYTVPVAYPTSVSVGGAGSSPGSMYW